MLIFSNDLYILDFFHFSEGINFTTQPMQGHKWLCDTLQVARGFLPSQCSNLPDEQQIMGSCWCHNLKSTVHCKQGRWNLSVPKSIAAWRESEFLPLQRGAIHSNNSTVILSRAIESKMKKKKDIQYFKKICSDIKKKKSTLFLYSFPAITKV